MTLVDIWGGGGQYSKQREGTGPRPQAKVPGESVLSSCHHCETCLCEMTHTFAPKLWPHSPHAHTEPYSRHSSRHVLCQFFHSHCLLSDGVTLAENLLQLRASLGFQGA